MSPLTILHPDPTATLVREAAQTATTIEVEFPAESSADLDVPALTRAQPILPSVNYHPTTTDSETTLPSKQPSPNSHFQWRWFNTFRGWLKRFA